MKNIHWRWPAILFVLFFCSVCIATDDTGKEVRKQIMRERILDHFILGVEAPVEWLNETRDKQGAKWDARIQYFSGGAAKEITWDTVFLNPWNKFVNPRKERGTWGEKMFLKPTLDNGYLPWITFYNLAQSNPADYKPDPPHATVQNMQVPETMRSYFEQIKLLMQLCDQHKPKPVVVQFEPDEWGHMLISGHMDPAAVNVKVGSTGMPELKDLPDNLIGYAHAIKLLRDRYAPMNVLIGCNPSGWDSKGSMSGKRFGEYLNKCGCNEWDLAVFETGDRDKGMQGKMPPYGDQAGITGSFDNHINWIKEFHQTTGLYVVVWQVAVGNNYFCTCDNTPGHYCDNIAQMLLEGYPNNPTIARYVQAGCAGFMFNAGQGDSTKVYDARKDGITNPTPIAGNLGNKSEYADDDGGYMRLRGAAYYKNPFPILGKSVAAAKPSPKPVVPVPLKLSIDDSKLAEWNTHLQKSAMTISTPVQVYLRVSGPANPEEKTSVLGADEKSLFVLIEGNKMPFSWKSLSLHEHANLAKALATDNEINSLLTGAVFLKADGRSEEAEQLFDKAEIKNPAAVQAARAAFVHPAESGK